MSGAYENERYVYIGQDGTTYNLHNPPRRVVISDEGTGIPPLEYVTQRAPFQQGETRRTLRLLPRVVRLVIRQNACDRSAYWDLRSALIGGVRPNKGSIEAGGVLRKIYRNGRKRDLSALISAGPKFEPRDPTRWDEWAITESLYFTAHDPIYYDPVAISETILLAVVATFPMTFPVVFMQYNATTTITYLGDWPAFPTIVITGPIKGPVITNVTTGEHIGLNASVPAGFTATIELTSAIKRVTRSDGLDMTGAVTSDSDLSTFHLEPGANVITVEGDNVATATTSFVISYYERYLGL